MLGVSSVGLSDKKNPSPQTEILSMPLQQTVLRVFVASPAEVNEERSSLEEIVRELNLIWSDEFNIRLELVRWETHVYPDFAQDSQQVINQQIADEYDIFIGIMWTRLGTPTNRAPSGTVEEFERAYRRFRDDPSKISIMFYFKDMAVTPSKIDPEQLASVQKFKKKIGECGGLHWDFKTIDEFRSLLRVHISRAVKDWRDRLQVGSARVTQAQTAPVTASLGKLSAVTEENDETGFIDLVEQSTQYSSNAVEVINTITESLGQLADNINKRAAELNVIPKPLDTEGMQHVKKITNQAADDMNQYVVRTKAIIPEFSKAVHGAIRTFGSAVSLSLDFEDTNKSQLDEALKGLTTLRSQMRSSRNSISSFRATVAGLPRITTKFNRAKRDTIETLDLLLNEFDSGDNLTESIELAIRELIEKSNKN